MSKLIVLQLSVRENIGVSFGTRVTHNRTRRRLLPEKLPRKLFFCSWLIGSYLPCNRRRTYYIFRRNWRRFASFFVILRTRENKYKYSISTWSSGSLRKRSVVKIIVWNYDTIKREVFRSSSPCGKEKCVRCTSAISQEWCSLLSLSVLFSRITAIIFL